MYDLTRMNVFAAGHPNEQGRSVILGRPWDGEGRLWRTVVALLVAAAMAANLLNMGARFAPINPIYLRIRLLGVAVAIGLMSLIVYSRMTRVHSAVLLRCVPWMIFGGAIVLSGVYHVNAATVVEGLWVSVGIPALFLLALPRYLKTTIYPAIVSVLILAGLPYIVISLIKVPLEYPYRGILGNPNQMGMLLAGIGWGLLGLIRKNVLYGRLLRAVTLTLCAVAVLAMIMMTGSRTSLASYAVAVIMFVLTLPRRRVSHLVGGILAAATSGAVLIASILVLGISPWSIAEGIVNKHRSKVGDSLFASREVAWQHAMENARILGEGPGALEKQVGYSAHNSFISTLSSYGVLAMFGLLCVAGIGGIMAWKYYKRNKDSDPYAPLPMIVFAGFWTLAMAEGLFGSIGRGVTIALFLAYGAVASAPRKRSARLNVGGLGQAPKTSNV